MRLFSGIFGAKFNRTGQLRLKRLAYAARQRADVS
jgi:hypothetical protein